MDNFHKIERLYGKENKVMKNMKVRTKLNLILVLVILLVALGSVVSVKNMEDVKDKALETMDASSRQSYDDSIKEQVGVVISLLTEINEEYKAGTYTLDEANRLRQRKCVRCVTERLVTSGLTSQMVQMWFCLAVIPRGRTVWIPRMQKDTRW